MIQPDPTTKFFQVNPDHLDELAEQMIPNVRYKVADLYLAYSKIAGESSATITTFSRAMSAHGFKRYRVSTHSGFYRSLGAINE